jgi:hypothetical protein
MTPPRYIVVPYESRKHPAGTLDSAWVVDTQSPGEWGEHLRVLLATPASAAHEAAARFNAADPPREQETDS